MRIYTNSTPPGNRPAPQPSSARRRADFALEAADTAFEIADELRRVLGLSWTDILGRAA